MTQPPLIVDLDGTLILSDMLHESTLNVLRDTPLNVLRIPFWLAQGKATLKRHLALRSSFDPGNLPYHANFLDWLRQQHEQGRTLILCTASDRRIATAVAGHLGLFDEVMASDGNTNLAGTQKARALLDRFGSGGFDYAGNSHADLAVWRYARHAVVVNATESVSKKAAALCTVTQEFSPSKRTVSTWRTVLRVHQWMKNALLFAPLLAAHQFANPDKWMHLGLAFLAFSLCASSVYIVNDLLDLESDRQHPRKRQRPFAAGRVSIQTGVALAPVLLFFSLLLAQAVGGAFLSWLLLYFALTCAYSWGLKRMILVDCLTLAVLYTLRIVAGAAAASLALSFWLLAFSVFLFLSLAFVKRYAELEVEVLAGRQRVHGRGYYTSDAPLIQTLGVAAGYAAVLVLALYLNSDAVVKLYRAPEAVWGTIPIMLFWVSWMWMQAHRGKMHDDPVVFAIKDRASLVSGLAFAAILAVGASGVPWIP